MSYLEKISQEPNFNVGDKVVCIDADYDHAFKIGEQYTISDLEYDVDYNAWYVSLKELDLDCGCEWYASRFEKAN